MRILLTSVAIEGGGAERVVVDLACGLQAAGHDVMVAFLEGTDQCVPRLEAAGIRCQRLLPRKRLAAHALADFTPSCIPKLAGIVRRFRPHVIHCHVPRPTLWLAMAKRLYGLRAPVVYTEHNIQEAYPGWATWVYRAFLPACDHIICISQAARESFLSRWRWPEERVTHIWNGIDAGRVKPGVSGEQVRAGEGVSADAPIVLNVGNLTSRKAQENLVAAMAIIGTDLPQAHCWIAGSPENEPATAKMLEQEIARRKVAGTVRLLGARSDVPDLLNACDLFVLSSRQEGFPITILEAMAAGKPVVATDVGGCSEAVAHGETGLIVPPEAPEALAEALAQVLTHSGEAAAMGQAARLRVEQNFTTGAMIDRHLAVYEKMAAERV